MPAALIAQLIATLGPSALQLIDTLVANWTNPAGITPAQWQALSASLKQTSTDRMTAALTEAGIDPSSPQGQKLLALAK
ncbi:MAG: hypothetical protein KGL39_08625 [Patescibacteria group bacterium]|nr:hypothetical protein [Patescibacteria group bacterium]